MVHICYPRTWRAEASGWKQVQGQPGLGYQVPSHLGLHREQDLISKRKSIWWLQSQHSGNWSKRVISSQPGLTQKLQDSQGYIARLCLIKHKAGRRTAIPTSAWTQQQKLKGEGEAKVQELGNLLHAHKALGLLSSTTKKIKWEKAETVKKVARTGCLRDGLWKLRAIAVTGEVLITSFWNCWIVCVCVCLKSQLCLAPQPYL